MTAADAQPGRLHRYNKQAAVSKSAIRWPLGAYRTTVKVRRKWLKDFLAEMHAAHKIPPFELVQTLQRSLAASRATSAKSIAGQGSAAGDDDSGEECGPQHVRINAEDLASAMQHLPRHVQHRFRKLGAVTVSSATAMEAAVDVDGSFHHSHLANALEKLRAAQGLHTGDNEDHSDSVDVAGIVQDSAGHRALRRRRSKFNLEMFFAYATHQDVDSFNQAEQQPDSDEAAPKLQGTCEPGLLETSRSRPATKARGRRVSIADPEQPPARRRSSLGAVDVRSDDEGEGSDAGLSDTEMSQKSVDALEALEALALELEAENSDGSEAWSDDGEEFDAQGELEGGSEVLGVDAEGGDEETRRWASAAAGVVDKGGEGLVGGEGAAEGFEAVHEARAPSASGNEGEERGQDSRCPKSPRGQHTAVHAPHVQPTAAYLGRTAAHANKQPGQPSQAGNQALTWRGAGRSLLVRQEPASGLAVRSDRPAEGVGVGSPLKAKSLVLDAKGGHRTPGKMRLGVEPGGGKAEGLSCGSEEESVPKRELVKDAVPGKTQGQEVVSLGSSARPRKSEAQLSKPSPNRLLVKPPYRQSFDSDPGFPQSASCSPYKQKLLTQHILAPDVAPDVAELIGRVGESPAPPATEVPTLSSSSPIKVSLSFGKAPVATPTRPSQLPRPAHPKPVRQSRLLAPRDSIAIVRLRNNEPPPMLEGCLSLPNLLLGLGSLVSESSASSFASITAPRHKRSHTGADIDVLLLSPTQPRHPTLVSLQSPTKATAPYAMLGSDAVWTDPSSRSENLSRLALHPTGESSYSEGTELRGLSAESSYNRPYLPRPSNPGRSPTSQTLPITAALVNGPSYAPPLAPEGSLTSSFQEGRVRAPSMPGCASSSRSPRSARRGLALSSASDTGWEATPPLGPGTARLASYSGVESPSRLGQAAGGEREISRFAEQEFMPLASPVGKGSRLSHHIRLSCDLHRDRGLNAGNLVASGLTSRAIAANSAGQQGSTIATSGNPATLYALPGTLQPLQVEQVGKDGDMQQGKRIWQLDPLLQSPGGAIEGLRAEHSLPVPVRDDNWEGVERTLNHSSTVAYDDLIAHYAKTAMSQHQFCIPKKRVVPGRAR